MELTEKIMLAVYLVWASLHDIKEKTLPVAGLVLGGVIVLLEIVITGGNKVGWGALLPGVILFLFAKVSDEIGEADGIVLIFVACICNTKKAIAVFSISLIYIFFYSVFVFAGKKNLKSRIPYLPFLTVAYLTAWKI